MRATTLSLVLAAAALSPVGRADGARARWHISGMFAEACSCSPPCTCNFGMSASPHHFCYTIFSYGIKNGQYNGVLLDGLTLACAKGQAGFVWYIDRCATPSQASALRAIAQRIVPLRGGAGDAEGETALASVPAAILQEVTDRGSRLQIDGAGGFDNTFLLGLDGKTPVVVLNNTTFNLKRSMKGRTSSFRYKDQFGNDFDFKGTNTNTGEFDYDQDTRKFLG